MSVSNFYGVLFVIYSNAIANTILHILLYTSVIKKDTFVGFPIFHGLCIFLHVACVAIWYAGKLNVDKFKVTGKSGDINSVEDFFLQFLWILSIYAVLFSLSLWLFFEDDSSFYLTFAVLGIGLGLFIPLGVRRPALKGNDEESGRTLYSNESSSVPFSSEKYIVEKKDGNILIEEKSSKKNKKKDKNKSN